MSDLITKNDIRDSLKATLQKILDTHANITKNEAKAEIGLGKLEKAWPKKQAGEKLPRSKPSVFALVEGHRPVKANEALQHGDKIAVNNGGNESWLTLDQTNPSHAKHIGFIPVNTKNTDFGGTSRWHANINNQYQRPISQVSVPTPTPIKTSTNPRFDPEIGKQLGHLQSTAQPAPAAQKPASASSTWSSTSGATPNYVYKKTELAKAGDPTNNPAFTGAGSDVSDNNMGAEQISLGFDKAALNPVVKRAMKKTIPSMKKALVPAPTHACPSCKGEVVIVGRSGNIEHGLCKGCGESPHRTIQEENAAAQPSSGLGAVSKVNPGQTIQEENKSALPKEGLGKAEGEKYATRAPEPESRPRPSMPKIPALGDFKDNKPKTLTPPLKKATPPGEEKLVHKLKDEYGHDKAGKEKAYATAWSIHNKMNKAALNPVVKRAMKKDELEIEKGTVGEKANPEASLPPKDPKAPKKNGNGDTNSDNKGIIRGKALDKGAISDAVDKARNKAKIPKNKDLKSLGFPGVAKDLNKKSIATEEAEKAKEKAEKQAQNPNRVIPKDINEKLKEKQKEAGQVQKAEGIPKAPTAPKPSGMTIPKIAPRSITKPISTLPPQTSKL